jgi:hypothetical protein
VRTCAGYLSWYMRGVLSYLFSRYPIPSLVCEWSDERIQTLKVEPTCAAALAAPDSGDGENFLRAW